MKEIKREIVISAPAAKVWEHLIRSENIAGWLMPNDFEAVVGKGFILDCRQQGTVSCVIKEIVPQKKLVYSFRSKATQVETLVTFTLAEEGGATRVTLRHTGWDALPPDQQGIAEGFREGWGAALQKLQQRTCLAI